MKSLGIVYGHDATVCLVSDGAVVFCQSEERFNRTKGSSGFPALTVDYLYKHIISPDQIDMAVLYESEFQFQYLALKERGFQPRRAGYLAKADPIFLDSNSYAVPLRKMLLRTRLGRRLRAGRFAKMRTARLAATTRERDEALDYFAQSLGLPSNKIRGLDHHLAHAYSAVPNVNNWGATLIFTLDGWGDGHCATVNVLRRGRLQTLSVDDEVHSLGTYYRYTTLILGLRATEDEYKVMGLAAYARPDQYQDIAEEIRKLIRIDERGQWESQYSGRLLFTELERIFRHRRFDYVAGAIQHVSEQLVCEWIRFWIQKTGCHNVALAGGVFMNVKISQRVAEMECVNKMHVVPAAGDESSAIGCAMWGQTQGADTIVTKPVESLYLGVEFSEEQIRSAISESSAAERYLIERPEHLNVRVAELVAAGQIVARYAGRMEFGPRALGNRSIIADPRDVRNVSRINSAIKNRDFWMPLAPSILEEDASRYVQNLEKVFAPYMCIAFESMPEAHVDLAAAIHSRDRTVRPQIVRQAWNPDYHEIIRLFKEQTGVGAVLNTSFNLHGEPIVCSPEDAIRSVDASEIYHLAIGPFLLTKSQKSHLRHLLL